MVKRYFDRNNKMIHIGSQCQYFPDELLQRAYPDGLKGLITYENDLFYFNAKHIDADGKEQRIKWRFGPRFIKRLEVLPPAK